jgi:hypothetical protein
MKLTDGEWSKWQEWMRKIHDDLSPVVDDQEIAREFDAVIKANAEWIDAHEGGLFCDFVRRSHAIAALLAIRRHLSEDRDSVSILRLLSQISTCAEQFTYAFYLRQFPTKEGEDDPWQQFTYQAFSKDGVTFDRSVVDADIAKTEDVARNLKTLVNRTLAHLDHRGCTETVTYKDVRDAVDYFNQLVCKYHGLITSNGYGDLKTSILFPWRKIFEVPLIKPNDRGTTTE